MAQLSDDRAAFGGALLPVAGALGLISRTIAPITGGETVGLIAAAGRISDRDVVAGLNVPPFDNSAVDGYAVRHVDLAPEGSTVLPVSSRLPAGVEAVAPIMPGTAVRIFTGAPMPDEADTVFMQEDVRAEGGNVLLPAGLKRGANRRFAGEDFQLGDIVIRAGTRIDPRHVAALAALGLTQLDVRRRVRVALFSTGDEIVPPGQPLRPGTQYDSNRFLLTALLARRGAEVHDLGVLPDRRDEVAAALAKASAQHDLILTSGGGSTGEEDHVRQALEDGGTLDFWRLAIKPGRPVAMGRIGDARFVGLPGNPVASFVTFVRFAGPLVDHLSGGAMREATGTSAIADFSYRKKEGRREYVRATLAAGADGRPVVRKFPREGAALISSLTGTDGLVELDEAVTEIAPGDAVRFLPYDLLF